MAHKELRLGLRDIILPPEYFSRQSFRRQERHNEEKRRALDASEEALDRVQFTRGLVLYGYYRDIRYLTPSKNEYEQVLERRQPPLEVMQFEHLERLKERTRSESALSKVTPSLSGEPVWTFVRDIPPERRRRTRVLSDGERIIRVIGEYPLRNAA